MKKYIVISAVILLAAGCAKKQPAVSVNSNPSVTSGVQQAQPQQSAPAAKPGYVPQAAPLKLLIYNDPAGVFKINYTSDFLVPTAAMLSGKDQAQNASACQQPDGPKAAICLVLKGEPYKNTTFSSAAVSFRVRPDKAGVAACAAFTQVELAEGHVENPATVNGHVFVVADSDETNMNQHYQTKISRAYYGGKCYEIDESLRWVNADVYDPPRREFDRPALWAKLDVIRGGFWLQK